MNRIKLLLNMAIITFLFWPQTSGISQLQVPDKRIEQENKDLSERLKTGIITIANNNDTIAAALKTDPVPQEPKIVVKKKVIVKEVPVVKEKPIYVPVYKDTLYVSMGVSVEKPVIIYQTSPIYSNGETKYLTFSRWRDSTGLKSEKEYKKYLKALNIIK